VTNARFFVSCAWNGINKNATSVFTENTFFVSCVPKEDLLRALALISVRNTKIMESRLVVYLMIEPAHRQVLTSEMIFWDL